MLNHTEGPVMESKPEEPIRGRWLANCSAGLAMLIEVLPTEAGMTSMLSCRGLFWPWLIGKVVFLTIILLPLAIYFAINGRKGWRCARREVITTLVIVVINLVLNVMVWSGML